MTCLYSDTESDFYQYLTLYGEVSPRTRTNYLSWLRFLDKEYIINNSLNSSDIEEILVHENKKRHLRSVYKKEKDVRNFYFALKKYNEFLTFDLPSKKSEITHKEIVEIEKNTQMSVTEKETVLLSRIGQGKFRNQLITYWNGCSISHFGKADILIASHIKPWRSSDNFERTDLFNGLLLLPNYDKLFDKGYISFDEKGKILYSKLITKNDKKTLGMNDDFKLFKIENNHKDYLLYHYNNCFMK